MHGAELITGIVGAAIAYRADDFMIRADKALFPWISVIAPFCIVLAMRVLA